MTISILTLFPEMFKGPFGFSIIKRAKEKKLIKINLINIRQFAKDRYKTVDDRPYGGGVGMIMKVDVIDRAINSTRKIKKKRDQPKASPKESSSSKPSSTLTEKIVLLDPKGVLFSQKKAKEYARLDHLILICGHYEGVDARVEELVDETLSIGDYILTGGEIASMVIVDSVSRLLPGVLKKEEAIKLESFSSPLLEAPQFTRPYLYKGLKVPKILLSGNHKKIKEWKKKQSLKRTFKLRPDLLRKKKDSS